MSRKTEREKDIRLAPLPTVKDICCEVRQRLNMSMDVSDERVYACIDEVIMEASRGRYMGLEYKVNLRESAFNSLRRLDVLQKLLEDDEITEIMINGYDNIFVEKREHLHGQVLSLKVFRDMKISFSRLYPVPIAL